MLRVFCLGYVVLMMAAAVRADPQRCSHWLPHGRFAYGGEPGMCLAAATLTGGLWLVSLCWVPAVLAKLARAIRKFLDAPQQDVSTPIIANKKSAKGEKDD